MPSIVASLGYTANQAQLMSVPPFAASFVGAYMRHANGLKVCTDMLVNSIHLLVFPVGPTRPPRPHDHHIRHHDHDRLRHVPRYVSLSAHTPTFSCQQQTTDFHTSRDPASTSSSTRYGALFLVVPGTYSLAPPLAAWVSNNSAPHTRRATALALLTTMTNAGGILATWLLGALSAPPRYQKASVVFLVFQVGTVVCAVGNWVRTWIGYSRLGRERLNRERKRERGQV